MVAAWSLEPARLPKVGQPRPPLGRRAPSRGHAADYFLSPAPQAEPQAEGLGSPAPQAEPQAEGLGSPAPQAEPQAEGLGSPAPQAKPQAEGFSGLSPAPQAVPQEGAVFWALWPQANRFFSPMMKFLLKIFGSKGWWRQAGRPAVFRIAGFARWGKYALFYILVTFW